jgi:hypothetical protein
MDCQRDMKALGEIVRAADPGQLITFNEMRTITARNAHLVLNVPLEFLVSIRQHHRVQRHIEFFDINPVDQWKQ